MTDEKAAAVPERSLFSGAPQHEHFPHLGKHMPMAHMTRAKAVFHFPQGAPADIPARYEFAGREEDADAFFVDTDTVALLVLKDGSVRYERYALTGGSDVQWISWSVAKSFVSALVGIAIDEGRIGGVDDPISRYITVEPGSAYDGVPIRHVLQMSSGARWREDYSDPASDVFRLSAAMREPRGLSGFVATMTSDAEPGTVCRYNSGDTQALGALLVAATGRSIADYMQEKLVEPLGMEAPGHWLCDSEGMEMAFGGLKLTARDFAKLGELYRNDGVWQGAQVVPRPWVRASTKVDGPHMAAGMPRVADQIFELGYGFQWWLPAGDRGEFCAIGVYNQFVYVDPSCGVVIVKLSANRGYGTAMDEPTNREMENIAFLRSIARSFD